MHGDCLLEEISQSICSQAFASDLKLVAWFGRCRPTENNTVLYSMPGVRFGVIISGTRNLRIKMCGGFNYFTVIVSDVATGDKKVITIESSNIMEWVNVLSDLDSTRVYDVRVIKKTEPELRGILSRFYPVEVWKLRVDRHGHFQVVDCEKMFYPNGWIEVIGDSDACGFGVNGKASHIWNIFSMDGELQDVERAWGAVVGKIFGYGCITVAWSGKGILRNATMCGSECLPEIWLKEHKSSLEWISLPPPKMILILAGGNDFFHNDIPPRTEFVNGFIQFLEQLRKVYTSDVPIFCFVCSSNCCSSAGNPSSHPKENLVVVSECEILYEYIQEAVKSISATTVFQLTTKLEIKTDYGIMMHWNEPGQSKIGHDITRLITNYLRKQK